MSLIPFAVAIQPGRPNQFVRQNKTPGLIAQGYKVAGKYGVYDCYLLESKFASLPRASSGAVRLAKADVSCKFYSQGQRMGNTYELVGT